MCKDIMEAFWKTYENKAWERYSKLSRVEESDAYISKGSHIIGKHDILESWRKEGMMMIPPIEHHHNYGTL